jgi:hypothetical protein
LLQNRLSFFGVSHEEQRSETVWSKPDHVILDVLRLLFSECIVLASLQPPHFRFFFLPPALLGVFLPPFFLGVTSFAWLAVNVNSPVLALWALDTRDARTPRNAMTAVLRIIHG